MKLAEAIYFILNLFMQLFIYLLTLFNVDYKT